MYINIEFNGKCDKSFHMVDYLEIRSLLSLFRAMMQHEEYWLFAFKTEPNG